MSRLLIITVNIAYFIPLRMLIIIMYARLFAMSAMNMILGILRGEAVFCA